MILRIQDQFEMSMNDLEIKFNIAVKSENLTEKKCASTEKVQNIPEKCT